MSTRHITKDKIAALMAFEAFTLAIASAIHLSGAFGAASRPFNGTAAGVAEAIIMVALAAGATALVRSPARGESLALLATSFAILGFGLGLTLTVRGGDAPDIAYHAAMLPLLILTASLLIRSPREAVPSA